MRRIKCILRRYNQIRMTYVGNQGLINQIAFIIDYLGAFLIHGASFNDYFGYRFNTLNRRGRKEFVTLRRTRKLQRSCNSRNHIFDFRDKIRFNTIYSDFIGRKWLDVSSSTPEEFKSFIGSVGDQVFVKDVAGLCGIGVNCLKTNDIDATKLYNELTANPSVKFLLEERIEQTGLIAEIHPWSVNTIRMTTLYDPKRDVVNIVGAVLRIGTSQNSRDNLHAGGVAAHVDINTGIIFRPAFDKSNHTYIFHPDTGKQLVGFKIPDWERCKEFVRQVARITPEIRYVGWDVVIKGDGTFLLIEGNDNADHDVQQLHYKGLWREYQKLSKA